MSSERGIVEEVHPEVAPFREGTCSITSTSTKSFIYGEMTSSAAGSCTAYTGQYTQPDPLGLKAGTNLYVYAVDNPILNADPSGLKVRMCCRPISKIGTSAKVNHCYFQYDNGDTLGLYPAKTSVGLLGLPSKNNPDDKGGDCGPWSDGDLCVAKMGMAHVPFPYNAVPGPNSNTYAHCISSLCSVPTPSSANEITAPGWNSPSPWSKCQKKPCADDPKPLSNWQ